jgi:hypothetical protein
MKESSVFMTKVDGLGERASKEGSQLLMYNGSMLGCSIISKGPEKEEYFFPF